MSKARLPTPGEDVGNWGEILNDFLLVALNNDGTLKAEDTILAKANNSDVVHNSGVETVSGVKTFLSTPIVPSPSAPMHAVNKTYTDAALATKANTDDLADVATSGSFLDLKDVPAGQDTSLNVLTTGTQTISGAKNFTGGLEISGQAAVATNDARLSNTRTPTDNTVTAVKVVDGAVTKLKLSAAVQATLDKADSALQSEQVTSVAGKTGAVTLNKGDVGLGDIDNTADSAKPVSIATQTALDLKANTTSLSEVATTGSYSNLLDKPNIPAAGTTTGTYAAGDDGRISGALQKSVVTAKGDLLVATGSGAVTHLGVGSDGQVLLADSSQVQGVKWSSPSSNSAITRSINSVTGTTSAGAEAHTDYVYILTGNYALTLPTAVGNTNRYTIKNRNSANVSLIFSGAENADGAGVTLGPNETVELISDGVNWIIL